MLKLLLIVLAVWLCGLIHAARAETYSLTDGASLNGDIITFDDIGVKLRLTDGTYTDRISWTKFSQESLQQLSNNPKIKPLVEPFLDIPASERPQKPEINLQPVQRLDRPPPQSLLGALFSSSVGLFYLFLIYAANIYAAFEIAVVRSHPKALVMGVAAVAPILGPIIFLAMPARAEPGPVESQPEGDPATFAVPGQVLAADEIQVGTGSRPPASSGKTEGQVFQRGQFTFNRRFFETKFSGFFGVVRHGADKDMSLLIKTGGSQFSVERITRIAASDVHLEVTIGEVRQEIMVPFSDIQEIQLKPRKT